jgi:hypothetical protein
MKEKLPDAASGQSQVGYNRLKLRLTPGRSIPQGEVLCVHAEPDDGSSSYTWRILFEHKPIFDKAGETAHIVIHTDEFALGCYTIEASVKRANTSGADDTRTDEGNPDTVQEDFVVTRRAFAPGDMVNVTLNRAGMAPSSDQILWSVIRSRTQAIAFPRYKKIIESALSPNATAKASAEISGGTGRDLRLPFPFVEAYEVLKIATEAFLMTECGVVRFDLLNDEFDRVGRKLSTGELTELRHKYLSGIGNSLAGSTKMLPYLSVIQQRLSEVPLKKPEETTDYYGIDPAKLSDPCLVELIWSYWHEEGMLVQTMNAISRRFQNKRSYPGAGRDPLAHLELDPLRPLNNLLWSHIQDEQHTLSVMRRAHEYDHEYGLRLYGRAVGNIRPVDSRSRFVEAFHNLLHIAWEFFKESDDTTIVPDAFPVLTALRDVHLLLAHGAHNQFGDLPSTARMEMLMQMWLLSRPEVREFLGGRIMVPYSEPWMDRVDAMKAMQGWNDVSITHFHDLAVTGEQIVLSIRYGNWTDLNLNQLNAANWARYWRPEIYQYIHAYRAVTGVDLTADMVSSEQRSAMYRLPSDLMRERLDRVKRTSVAVRSR